MSEGFQGYDLRSSSKATTPVTPEAPRLQPSVERTAKRAVNPQTADKMMAEGKAMDLEEGGSALPPTPSSTGKKKGKFSRKESKALQEPTDSQGKHLSSMRIRFHFAQQFY